MTHTCGTCGDTNFGSDGAPCGDCASPALLEGFGLLMTVTRPPKQPDPFALIAAALWSLSKAVCHFKDALIEMDFDTGLFHAPNFRSELNEASDDLRTAMTAIEQLQRMGREAGK